MGITTAAQQGTPDDGWRTARKCGVCGHALHRPPASDGSWLRCGRCGSEWDAAEQRELAPQPEPRFDAEPTTLTETEQRYMWGDR